MIESNIKNYIDGKKRSEQPNLGCRYHEVSWYEAPQPTAK